MTKILDSWVFLIIFYTVCGIVLTCDLHVQPAKFPAKEKPRSSASNLPPQIIPSERRSTRGSPTSYNPVHDGNRRRSLVYSPRDKHDSLGSKPSQTIRVIRHGYRVPMVDSGPDDRHSESVGSPSVQYVNFGS